ncbi:MAG TPA: polysaccharide deacetylase family protein, partial [Bacilli bacterium]|nr:polysaccharide deacetylase family protein [Bacilli bacterium]
MKKRSVFVLTVSRARLLLGAAACLFLLLGLFWHNTSAAPHQIPHVVATINDTDDDQLRERVELLAKQYNANPIDAKKDPVWKAIPGLNGIRVDVERTIKQAKQAGAGSDKIPLAVDQLPPNVSLDQLGALPIYRGNPEKKQIALMINVAWGTEFLPDMLDTLDKYHAHATFFLDGDWAMQNKKLAREIVKRGHEIGSHGYKHPDMSKLGKKAQINQINRTNSMIKQAAGVDANLFAPPGGAYNGTTVEVAHSFKMRTILWTLDTLDWRKPPAATITDKVLQKAGNGTLVLMHPTAPTREALRT